jgi:DNA-binding NarL/FixJ family response regulator
MSANHAMIQRFLRDYVVSTVTLQSAGSRPYLYLCSRHPLVIQVLAKIVAPHVTIEYQGDISDLDISIGKRGCHTLLVDTCSLDQCWQAANEWRESQGPVIALVPRSPDYAPELHALQMGAQGVVAVSPGLERELLEAVHAVANGQLWMKPDTMAEYARRYFETSTGISPAPLTRREQQIVKFIQEHFSNKRIAAALNISERTVKFHVSNILQKYQIKHRSNLFLVRFREVGIKNLNNAS